LISIFGISGRVKKSRICLDNVSVHRHGHRWPRCQIPTLPIRQVWGILLFFLYVFYPKKENGIILSQITGISFGKLSICAPIHYTLYFHCFRTLKPFFLILFTETSLPFSGICSPTTKILTVPLFIFYSNPLYQYRHRLHQQATLLLQFLLLKLLHQWQAFFHLPPKG